MLYDIYNVYLFDCVCNLWFYVSISIFIYYILRPTRPAQRLQRGLFPCLDLWASPVRGIDFSSCFSTGHVGLSVYMFFVHVSFNAFIAGVEKIVISLNRIQIREAILIPRILRN